MVDAVLAGSFRILIVFSSAQALSFERTDLEGSVGSISAIQIKNVEDLVKNMWWRQGVVRPAALLLDRLNKG